MQIKSHYPEKAEISHNKEKKAIKHGLLIILKPSSKKLQAIYRRKMILLPATGAYFIYESCT